MFVDTLTRASGHGCVDVQITFETPDGDQDLRLSAFVVHRSANRLGLMFRDLDAAAGQTIGDLLYRLDPTELSSDPASRAPNLTGE